MIGKTVLGRRKGRKEKEKQQVKETSKRNTLGLGLFIGVCPHRLGPDPEQAPPARTEAPDNNGSNRLPQLDGGWLRRPSLLRT